VTPQDGLPLPRRYWALLTVGLAILIEYGLIDRVGAGQGGSVGSRGLGADF